jgi:hypothetical protein
MENIPNEEVNVDNGAYAAGDNAQAIGARGVYARSSVQGSIITGDQNTIYFGFEQEIDWQNVDYSRANEVADNLFVDHMRRFAGAIDRETAVARYEPLYLQASSFTTTRDTTTEVSETEKQERHIFVWDEYIHYPCRILLVGEAGAGKTTQLLYAAQDMVNSEEGENPLPVFLSLRAYSGHSPAQLVENIAAACGVEIRVVDALLREGRKPVCLFLDGADELHPRDVEKLLKDIYVLFGKSGEQQHSVVISSRYGASTDMVMKSSLGFKQVEILPLSRDLIESLFERYGLPELKSFIKFEFTDVLQTPDLLSALSQGLRGKVHAELPKSVGQIYQLYVDSHLTDDSKSFYDYRYVILPVLGYIAVNMIEEQRTRLTIKDDLAAQLIDIVAGQVDRFKRLRQIAPTDWNLSHLLAELTKSPFVRIQKTQGGDDEVLFSKQGYRDYFAALYMCDDKNQERITQALRADERLAWLQPLFMMAGIKRGTNPLLETFYTLSTDYGIDIWMEGRPIGLISPQVVFEKAKTTFNSRKFSNRQVYTESITIRLIRKMLADSDPRTRFKATQAMTQWGMDGLEPLLDAVEDDHQLVAALATYALLHLGETREENNQKVPLPPLLSIDNGFQFTNIDGGGGVIGRVGPLVFVSSSYGQSTNKTELTLHIEEMDFDPFEVPSRFTLFHNGPVWFAHNWFGQKGVVNWIDLLAELNWIIDQTNQAYRRSLERNSVIQGELGQKLCEFLHLARLVEQDLGCQPLIELAYELPDSMREKIQHDYQQFRHMYRRNLRRKFLSPRPDGQTVNQSAHILAIESGGEVLGVLLKDMNIRSSFPARPDDRLYTVLSDHHIERMVGGKATAIGVQSLHEGQELLPTYMELQANMHVESAENCLIQGVVINNLLSRNGGMKIRANFHIERFYSSRLQGVLVDKLILSDQITSLKAQLEQLQMELEHALESDDPRAEAVYTIGRQLVDMALGEKLNRTLLNIISEGLRQVAEELADDAPEVKQVASNILQTVEDLTGD